MRLLNFLKRRPIEQRLASIAAMERAAKKRIPRFAYEYLSGGIGGEKSLARNLADFDKIQLVPRYLEDWEKGVDTTTTVFGKEYAAPFGPGPVGLTGLIWPGAQIHIARAAAHHKLPVGLSIFGTETIENISKIAADSLWFQLYPIEDRGIEEDLLERYKAVGGHVLIVTVDVPQSTRRERDIANGLAIPPRQDLRTYWQAAMRPRWTLETLRYGVPKFEVVARYADKVSAVRGKKTLLGRLSAGHVGRNRLQFYRDTWKGPIVLKGLLHEDDVRVALDMGFDGIVVSNHGGRQLDAAPTAASVLPRIRELVDGRMVILADGGVRSGLDIARLLSVGADFVLVGRAMGYALGAAGSDGPALALQILKEELEMTLSQIGCGDWRELGNYRYDHADNDS